MLKSMTAFGHAHLETKAGCFAIEIQSVNRKFLEVHVVLPPILSRFEGECKKWVSSHLARGQVTVKVSVTFEEIVPFIIKPNLGLARQLKSAWTEIARELDLDAEPIPLLLLKDVEGLFAYEGNYADEEALKVSLKEAFDKAFIHFLRMKNQEGAVLQADILSRLQTIRQSIAVIEQQSQSATNKYREKLMQRLEELLPGHIENEERILREIALFAEKIDITEEITRFNCHLSHFEEQMNDNVSSVGKTLEFICQELNREINTIGSKSSDQVIARLVIDSKSELERIREQIQNIE